MKRILSIPVLLMALLPLAGCGDGKGGAGGGDNGAARPGASNGANANGSVADFAKCARDHGVNVPDPDPDNPNVAIIPPNGTSRTQWEAVMQACRSHLPGGGAPQAPDPSDLNALRAYAVCMRAHDIEMTDPDPNTGKSQYSGRLANAGKGEIENDPTWQAANEACKDKLVTTGSK